MTSNRASVNVGGRRNGANIVDISTIFEVERDLGQVGCRQHLDIARQWTAYSHVVVSIDQTLPLKFLS